MNNNHYVIIFLVVVFSLLSLSVLLTDFQFNIITGNAASKQVTYSFNVGNCKNAFNMPICLDDIMANGNAMIKFDSTSLLVECNSAVSLGNVYAQIVKYDYNKKTADILFSDGLFIPKDVDCSIYEIKIKPIEVKQTGYSVNKNSQNWFLDWIKTFF